ncbi:leukocyte-associated immunoglobulin-like receptor 1 [Dromiciops gliroides]|uniref:leukocyte-associated immunoglobulin-like receptor 1 n=1 Tax=Dromiciops gliroides TaxID=33562 RepID=UPI001CC3EE4C|nr:leukocyte-associated immunoglobulin-like receptor 1 [Dromiciops gliroides]
MGIWIDSLPGKLHKPSLWAIPSPTIPVGSPVSIHCRGPPGARLYYVEKAGRPESLLKTHQPWPRNEVSFFISAVTPLNAGPYRCSYQLLAQWSEPSDVLELMPRGVPPREPHLQMELGSSTALAEPGPKAELGPKAKLGPTAEPSPTVDGGPSGPEAVAESTLQDYTRPNLLRVGLACLVLAVLWVLLICSGCRDVSPPPPLWQPLPSTSRTLPFSQQRHPGISSSCLGRLRQPLVLTAEEDFLIGNAPYQLGFSPKEPLIPTSPLFQVAR